MSDRPIAGGAASPVYIANTQVPVGSGANATQVQGTAADNAAAVGNPVQIGGVDGAGKIQSLRVGTSGGGYFQPARADDGTLAQFSAHYDAELATLIGFGTLAVQLGTVSDFATRLIRLPDRYADLNAVSIGAITTVITPAVGKKIRLLGGSLSVSAVCNVLFEDNVAGAFVFRTPQLLANTPYTFDLRFKPALAAADNVLKATASAAATITGTLWYTEE